MIKNMIKIPKSVLEDLQAAGLSRAEAVSLARERYAAIKEKLSPEDIEYLGKKLGLQISVSFDKVTFQPIGQNPKHSVDIKLKIRLRRDPVLCTVYPYYNRCKVDTSTILKYAPKEVMEYYAPIYAQEKIPRWFDKKSEIIYVKIPRPKPPEEVPEKPPVAPPVAPPTVPVAAFKPEDLLPAPPPYPPLPRMIFKQMGIKLPEMKMPGR